MHKSIPLHEGNFIITCSGKNDILSISYRNENLKGRVYSLFNNQEVEAKMFDPNRGKLAISQPLRILLFEILDLIGIMNSKNNCISFNLADFLFELFLNYYDRRYKKFGKHVLCIALWKSVLAIVYEWEAVNPGIYIHKGSPLYYLAESYILTGNIEIAFIYLFKALEQDLEAGKVCRTIHYPRKSPSRLVAGLITDKNNSMYYSVVLPARKEIMDALRRYRMQSSKPAITRMKDIDNKFLDPNKPIITNLNIINKFFVLELLKLIPMTTIVNKKVESSFSRMLLLNRLFGFSFVIDLFLHEMYSRSLSSPMMGVNVQNFVTKNRISNSNYLSFLRNPCGNGLSFRNDSVDNVLTLLLNNQHQVIQGFNLPEEIMPILVAYKVRNTSAHELQSSTVISQQFRDVVQKLYEALFVLISKLP